MQAWRQNIHSQKHLSIRLYYRFSPFLDKFLDISGRLETCTIIYLLPNVLLNILRLSFDLPKKIHLFLASYTFQGTNQNSELSRQKNQKMEKGFGEMYTREFHPFARNPIQTVTLFSFHFTLFSSSWTDVSAYFRRSYSLNILNRLDLQFYQIFFSKFSNKFMPNFNNSSCLDQFSCELLENLKYKVGAQTSRW